MVVGYVYPAYKCFKCVEMNRPDIDQLRFWCQYCFSLVSITFFHLITPGALKQIIIAIVTVLERLGDTFVSWLPLYSEAKLAFIIYLWCPKTLGTTYVYSSFLRPLVASHEGDIDRHLSELSTRAMDILAHYWQNGSVYAQSKFMEILRYVASQAPPARTEQGQGYFQPPPQPSVRPGYPPTAPPGYGVATSYQQPSQITDFAPSAPVIPSEYLYQSASSAGPTLDYASTQAPQTGYPRPIPGYNQPPYSRVELDQSLQVADVQPSLPQVSTPVTESTGGYMTRRQRNRKQS